MNERKRLSEDVERQVKRMKQAERDQPTVMAQSIFLGTLGLVFVVPVVVGAYLGRWLDGMVEGYSMRWTLSLLFLGLLVGAFNVYRMLRDKS